MNTTTFKRLFLRVMRMQILVSNYISVKNDLPKYFVSNVFVFLLLLIIEKDKLLGMPFCI